MSRKDRWGLRGNEAEADDADDADETDLTDVTDKATEDNKAIATDKIVWGHLVLPLLLLLILKDEVR